MTIFKINLTADPWRSGQALFYPSKRYGTFTGGKKQTVPNAIKEVLKSLKDQGRTVTQTYDEDGYLTITAN